ncbi:hypothetical protein BDF19DRAFT_437062 [Syncephalis fuscata]|nr:hypothetical protein BDF19DRAFT_437062 [Syncephalis fuscata]
MADYISGDYTLSFANPLPQAADVAKSVGKVEEGFEFISAEPNQPKNNDTADSDKTASTSSPFVDAMLAASTGNLKLTENSSVTYATTTSARVDFFFDAMSGTSREYIRTGLEKAWKEDPLDTLKLIFQLRDIRDGKGDRKEFYYALQWLRQFHPETFFANLPTLPAVGYWKDLAEFLLWETIDVEGVNKLEEEYRKREAARGRRYTKEVWTTRNLVRKNRREEFRKAASDTSEENIARYRKERAEHNQAEMLNLSKTARKERNERTKEKRDRVRNLFENDVSYQKLHVETARHFAAALYNDLELLKKNKSTSLAAKWAPTPRAHHDSYTLLATTIAQMLYPEAEHRKQGEELTAYVMRIRIQYQRDYLTPLRAKIPVVETLMSQNNWSSINYERVPSFTKHDKERFTGEKKIASGALMPHELVEEAYKHYMNEIIDVLETQWRSYVDKLAKVGGFDATMSVCDVSGSMNGTPMNAAIALSLLLTELTKPPFNQLLITFSEQPEIHHVVGETLVDRVKNVSTMGFGFSTNFQAVFDLILQQAKASNLEPEHMVKRLFVFSDMEFNQACTGGLSAFNTDYAVIVRKFTEAGYEVPEMIFWNLRGSGRDADGGSKPVTVNQKGVGMLSGFSGQMLKLFLENRIENMSPWNTLRAAIDIKKYEKLVVVD